MRKHTPRHGELLLAVGIAFLAVVATAARALPWTGASPARVAAQSIQTYVQLTRLESLRQNRACRLDLDPIGRELQVHDSMVLQYRKAVEKDALIAIHRAMTQICPYDDPLIIGSDADTSSISWGDVSRVPWPEDEGQDLSHLLAPPHIAERMWV